MAAGNGKIAHRIDSQGQDSTIGDSDWWQECLWVFVPAICGKFVSGSQKTVVSEYFQMIYPVDQAGTGL
jgi:hypothetical protein